MHLTIIPRARMGSELIAHEAEDSEAVRARAIYCFRKIQVVGQKNIETKHLSLFKARQNAIQPPLFWCSKPTLFATGGP